MTEAPPRAATTGPPSWRHLAWAWTACVAIVLAAAAVMALLAPDWIGDETHELDDDPLLVADILRINLLQTTVPLLGGWLAAGHRLAGREHWATVFTVIGGVIVVRSLLVIGAVGGADPTWLADAARWWLLELAALGTAAVTGLWLVRHPELRATHGSVVVRRALMVVVPALVCGALIEVLTA